MFDMHEYIDYIYNYLHGYLPDLSKTLLIVWSPVLLYCVYYSITGVAYSWGKERINTLVEEVEQEYIKMEQSPVCEKQLEILKANEIIDKLKEQRWMGWRLFRPVRNEKIEHYESELRRLEKELLVYPDFEIEKAEKKPTSCL
jgi:hypothetical protein